MSLFTKTAIPFTLFVSLLLHSCKKEVDSSTQNVSKHQLKTVDEKLLKKGQAILIYDATALHDSALYVNPPTNQIYEWKVLPNDACVSFWGNYQHGKAALTFHCPGRYQILASVYDPVSHQLVATTDTTEVNVTQDSLYAARALRSDGVITFRPTLLKSPDDISIQLFGTTSEAFEYTENQIAFTSTHTDNNYSFVIADSVSLITYPFANYRDKFWPAVERLDINGLKVGVPVTLNITWLGKTYTGKVTLLDYSSELKFEWDNSGPVKMP